MNIMHISYRKIIGYTGMDSYAYMYIVSKNRGKDPDNNNLLRLN